eukprot:CAMPEP_0185582542 /NCGR_PEP_ID=MMETSP0434-20130131/20945_1 /TAXON_ID=626734 ORGANISM="Favella taraikaensis, Strain Fe Narragansett Bay" /NCGR_SAMPLE_ID=MMETSP0434 /ASSEMBLY_ACC=CAM_ASM_000379 /LENGTH=224 /DNA_ID=CAMNT_0028201379 /DNA_START=538 /DNA_END=1213 /DNA_ORIENTATION=-
MGMAFGTATEDMDALTFGSKFLVRGFNSKKEPVTQIELGAVLEGFNMSMDEFIDLCIMCGCDYTVTIGGIGPIKAFKLIEENRTIEAALEKIRENNEDPKKKQKFIIPDNFLFAESRALFKSPDAITDREVLDPMLKWTKPDVETIKTYLIEEKSFQENKVTSGLPDSKAAKERSIRADLTYSLKARALSNLRRPNRRAEEQLLALSAKLKAWEVLVGVEANAD